MGKITVKHYLNKRVKPFIGENDNKERWPIYIQITQNRKTTQLRSFTKHAMSDDEFESFLKTGEIPDNKYYATFYKTNLYKEVSRIENILSLYLSGTYKLVDEDSNIVEILGEDFLKPAKDMLITLCWSYIYCRPKNNKEAINKNKLYQCFNQDINLLQNLSILKKYYNIDLTDKIPTDDYLVWHNMNLLIKHLDKDEALIDFIVRDYKSLIQSITGIKDKEIFTKQVSSIIENYTFR